MKQRRGVGSGRRVESSRETEAQRAPHSSYVMYVVCILCMCSTYICSRKARRWFL